jgi:tetratricopeptide (TPR) repeat protein
MSLRKSITLGLLCLGVVVLLSFGIGSYLLFESNQPKREVARESVSPGSKVEQLLREGTEHLENQKAEQALMAFREALALDPGSMQAQLGLAQGELAAGRDGMAIQEYERVSRLDQTNLVALLQLAQLYSHQSKSWKLSQAKFEEYLRLKPDDAQAQLGLARVLAWQGKSQQAVDVFSRQPVAELMTAKDRRDYVFALVKSGHHDKAEPLLQQLLTSAPNDFELKLQLASLYSARKDWSRALPLYRSLLSQRPNDLRVNMTYGLGLLASKDYKAALPPLRTACEGAPNQTEACLGYARALKGSGKLKDAARQFERVMPQYSRNASISREYADLLLEKKDYRESERYYKAAHNLGLGDEALLLGLAGALRGNGKSREALPYLEEAYRRQPTGRLAFELAKLYQKLGRNDKALELLNRIERSSKSRS